MSLHRLLSPMHAARWLPVAMLAPMLALAQAPAATDAQPPDTKAAPAQVAAPPPAPEAAPSPAAPAKGAPGKADAAGEPKVAPVPTGPIAPLAWLNGCWAGNVNNHEYREYWHPLRGGMMVGVGHNALPDRTVSYEHLRLESNADGVFYVAAPSGQKEVPFKLTGTKRDGPDEIFLFTNGANPFPQSITYRRATGGWLYVEVAGKNKGQDHKVIYPFRRVSCETGEFIRH
ncbi:MAG TPA: DUF6265 family protein [Casimicrobiaceae bacterium]|nr:DUF6265 family protein [Casimicrobiaceae bacterium]